MFSKDKHLPPVPQQIAQQPPFRTLYACMSLHKNDCIRFLGFPESDLPRLSETISKSWQRGIQDSGVYGGAYEIKLRGYPWSQTYKDEAKVLTRQLLESLYNMGWVLHASVDVSKKRMDKDSLIFRRQDPPPPPCYWLTISFDKSDRLTIYNSTPEINSALVQTFGQMVQKQEGSGHWFEIKFHGYPWRATGEETVTARLLLLQILGCLEIFGYSLYASIDQTNGPTAENASDADVLIFNRQMNWQPGAPIWHR